MRRQYSITCPDCQVTRVATQQAHSDYNRGMSTGRCRSCCNHNRTYPGMLKPWKGDKPATANDIERNRFYRDIRPLVLERDEFACVICTATPATLHVDHIKSWKDHADLRFNLENCRTLCAPCHFYVTYKKKLSLGQVWGQGSVMLENVRIKT